MKLTNTSSVAIAERYAQEHFGLSLPITPDEMKSAFRRRAKELHTDTSGDADTKDAFIAMKEAYDFLVGLKGMQFVYREKIVRGKALRFVTTDGTPLYELGLGLGPMKNGRDCERCGHKGYTEGRTSARNRRIYYFKCYECKGTGEIELFNPLFPKGRLINIVVIR